MAPYNRNRNLARAAQRAAERAGRAAATRFRATPAPRPTPGRTTFTPAPAPAPAPQVPPVPYDEAYDQGVSAADRRRDTTLAGLQYQEGRVRQSYGFDDPSDPYNQAAMLQRDYQQRQTGSTNSLARSGQLYSGHMQNQLDEGTFQYQRGRDALQKEYRDRLEEINRGRAEAGVTHAEMLAGLSADRIARAAQAPLTVPEPAAPAAAGPAAAAPARKGTNPRAGASMAMALWHSGRRTGPAWAKVIQQLGYDPRRGGRLAL